MRVNRERKWRMYWLIDRETERKRGRAKGIVESLLFRFQIVKSETKKAKSNEMGFMGRLYQHLGVKKSSEAQMSKVVLTCQKRLFWLADFTIRRGHLHRPWYPAFSIVLIPLSFNIFIYLVTCDLIFRFVTVEKYTIKIVV